jgi:hypothetical protein
MAWRLTCLRIFESEELELERPGSEAQEEQSREEHEDALLTRAAQFREGPRGRSVYG